MKLSFLILAVLPMVAQAQPAYALTPEQALKVRYPSELRFSPDGKRVAFTLREPPSGRSTQRHVWVYDLGSAEPRQWTSSTRSEHDPRWSPDGKYLAFLSDRRQSTQIWLMPVDGGEATELTSAKNSVQSFLWSPDSKQIAFVAADPRTEAEEKKAREFDDEKVIDKDDKPTRLWTIDLATKTVHQQTKGAWSVRELNWLPDGERLLLVATDQPSRERYTNRIYLLNLKDGHMEEVLAPRGPFQRVLVSPGGGSFAFVGARNDGPHAHDLFICPLNGHSPRNLTGASVDRPVASYEWINDSGFAVLFSTGFHSELMEVGGQTRKLATGDSVDPASFARSGGGSIAYVVGAAAAPPELWVDGKCVSHLNKALADLPLQKAEFYRYKSFDGTSIEAALYRPVGAAEGQPGPLVLLIHGGPTAAWRNQFDGLTQLLVAHGFYVMQPNIRGSTGYGEKFIESNRGDWGGADFKDVMAGVDDLVARKIADPNRLGIAGWSYGGYMSEWAITQTDRFKAAMCGAGLADLAVEFGTEASPVYDEWFYGTPYENFAAFRKSSPIAYIQNAKTPTLILQGDADTTDPISQSQMLYRGLKRYNVPAEFVVYPREPHGLREEKHLLDRYSRTVTWFEKYLGMEKK